MTFYHYTCSHGRRGIGDHGTLHPPHELQHDLPFGEVDENTRLMWTLIWVTDLPEPDIGALGLTNISIECERWRHRYRITNALPLRRYADMAYRFTLDFQADLVKPPAQPDHWWVSWRPLPAVYDPIEVAA